MGLQLGGLQQEEFGGTLRDSHHTYFVTDLQRSWYNSCFNEVRDVLTRHLESAGLNSSFTLGNSMGGFGALAFAATLPHCKTAIAFCPQSTVNPKLSPWENRWRDYVDAIKSWTVPDAVPLINGPCGYVAIYGDSKRDRPHAERLATASATNLLVIALEGGGHNIARMLKNRGVALASLIEKAQMDGPMGILPMLEGIPYEILHQPETA